MCLYSGNHQMLNVLIFTLVSKYQANKSGIELVWTFDNQTSSTICQVSSTIDSLKDNISSETLIDM